MKEIDYSKTIFSQGIVCLNKNNNTYCVVINGQKGTEDDRVSMVLEFWGKDGFVINNPPNRALIPTGRVVNLKWLKKVMDREVADEKY